MKKQVSWIAFLSTLLDPTSTQPRYQQIYENLRQAILAGQLEAGTRLPSTRLLAKNLGVARATIIIAFEQLLYEGYMHSIVGSGTYVADDLPDELLQARHLETAPTPEYISNQTTGNIRTLSQRGTSMAQTTVAPKQRNSHNHNGATLQTFLPGFPALHEFPFKRWNQLATKHWRQSSSTHFGYSDAAGYQPLRREIAGYLKAARGVTCDEKQIIIVSGSQQALYLATQILIDPGEQVWIEDPCYLGARAAFLNGGAQLIPIPVDQEGLVVEKGIEQAASARLAYVTPSHQFPMGVTMSLSRRLALLQWAERSGGWILEDDYDGEYRYAGRPLSSLQGLDMYRRVIYIGTFSKVLFPGLRLGYLVAPPDLVDAFVTVRAAIDRHPHMIDQLVLTDFIAEGHFARHIRRMRTLYQERQEIFVEQAKQELAGMLTVPSAHTGMHLLGWLPDTTSDTDIAHQIEKDGIIGNPLSAYYIAEPTKSGLVLGYTSFDPQEIKQGIQILARSLQSRQ